MKSLHRLTIRLLIASVALMPFSTQAGMLDTERVVATAAGLANRDKVRDFVNRTDVQKQLEALGLTASTAQDRVNALTQEEINRIAGKIDTLPAGASSTTIWSVIAVIIVGVIIWYCW
jgi:hypothetical protein